MRPASIRVTFEAPRIYCGFRSSPSATSSNMQANSSPPGATCSGRPGTRPAEHRRAARFLRSRRPGRWIRQRASSLRWYGVHSGASRRTSGFRPRCSAGPGPRRLARPPAGRVQAQRVLDRRRPLPTICRDPRPLPARGDLRLRGGTGALRDVAAEFALRTLDPATAIRATARCFCRSTALVEEHLRGQCMTSTARARSGRSPASRRRARTSRLLRRHPRGDLAADGTPCEPGEVGEVVVTKLHEFAMPFVRYRIGIARRGTEDGRPARLPAHHGHRGSNGDFVRTVDGREIHGSSSPISSTEFRGSCAPGATAATRPAARPGADLGLDFRCRVGAHSLQMVAHFGQTPRVGRAEVCRRDSSGCLWQASLRAAVRNLSGDVTSS